MIQKITPPLLKTVSILAVGLMIGVEPVVAYVASEYRTNADLAIGSMVSLDNNGALTPSSRDMMSYLGVVTAKNEGVVEVATSGTVSLLVSDIDGKINEGTQLGLSSLAGVATKSQDARSSIGVAVAEPVDWSESAVVGSGDESVRVGSAPVKLVEGKSTGQADGNGYLNALQRIANGIAGREIDTWRAITALLISIGGIVLAFVLLVSSSRSSFLSLGRNPMAGKAIMGGLWKVAAVAVVILLVSLLSAYLIVRSG